MVGYIFAVIASLALGGYISYLLQRTKSAGLKSEASRLPALEQQIENIRAENTRLLVELTKTKTTLEQEIKNSQEYLVFIENAEKRFADMFGKLSKDALAENSREFFSAAKTDFETRTKTIEQTLAPVKDNLDKLEKFNRDLESKRIGAYSSLEAHIKNLHETEEHLRNETSQLVKALGKPAVRGNWGQEQLRRVLEMAGMEEHIHFNEQVQMSFGTKTQIADLVLHLSDGKHIIVDSKAPLEIYKDVVNASTAEEQKEKLKSLTKHILEYAKDLQSKEYWKFYGDSPGVVVMFIPIESILNSAMQSDPALWSECIKKRVLLASPTTLIAILYSIAFGWRQEAFEKNAELIRKTGEDIYTRLAVFAEHLQDLGKHLTRSIGKYNEALGSLEHNVLPSARKMKDLGISSGKKILPDLPEIETVVRMPTSQDLFITSPNGEK